MTERPRDEVWDLLEELFGPVRTGQERGRRNKAVGELKAAGATLLEIQQTFRYCQRTFTHFGEMAICGNLTRATTVPTRETLPDQLARLRSERKEREARERQ